MSRKKNENEAAFRRLLSAAAAATLSLLVLAGEATVSQAQSPAKVLPPKATIGEAKRVALVIGNSAYRNVPALRNSVNDAAAVAEKVRELGYEVHVTRDLDRLGMNEAIGRFLLRVDSRTESLIYYAGHGIELHGANYLLPIDIPRLGPEQERLLRSEAINLTELLLDLESRSARVSLVILDACRENPFRTSGQTRGLGSTRGLGRVDPPRGTFVVYSAGVGELAVDNLGPGDPDPNGLFTRKFLRLMSVEGLELRTMVRQLRAEVREAALTGGHSQVPSYYDQLLGDFFFKPQEAAKQTTCDMLVKPNATRDEVLSGDIEPGFQACSRAVTEHPSEPRFVHLLYNAQEQRAVQRALKSDQPGPSEAYVSLFPSGRFIADVKAHLAALTAKAAAAKSDAVKPDAAKPAAPAIAIDPADIARLLQVHLKRVGCDPGTAEGAWDGGSRRALEAFNKHAGTKFDVKLASLDALDAVRGKTSRICPLACPRGQRVDGDNCIQISCDSGFVFGPDGTCKRRKEPSKPVARQEPRPAPAASSGTRGSGNCFTFNGKRFCE